MKIKPLKSIHLLITLGAILLACLLRLYPFGLLEDIELKTYDARVRYALPLPSAVATNLGFVFIDENTIDAVRRGAFGYRYGLYWPRSVYGRMVRELSDQGAAFVAFDVIFGERRYDHPSVRLQNGDYVESDDFFAAELKRASNVILAISGDLLPPPLFQTNALALGDISTEKDFDGKLRRVRAFRTYRTWHPAFLRVEADPAYGVDLRRASVSTNKVVLPRSAGDPIEIPLDQDGKFDLADFYGSNLPATRERKAKPFAEKRVWHMGLVLAAKELNLDLDNPEIDLPRGRIVLHGPSGLVRRIPVNSDGEFWIDWQIPPNHPALAQQAAHELLYQSYLRSAGSNQPVSRLWRDKLVVVGSSALANDLTDRGATPLLRDTLLVSKHWNVANSVLTGRFVTRSSLTTDLGLIIGLGLMGALLTWRFRALFALSIVLLMALAYSLVAAAAYTSYRVWLPVTVPIIGLLATHLCLLAWRVVFEQTERRRVKAVFAKMISPKVVNELLAAEKLSLGGAKVEVSVFFADLRGFTELTVQAQERALHQVRERALTGPAAEACFDQQARETLATVNAYLGVVAKVVIRNDGTLDKFIGDCVMAYWGAPRQTPDHSRLCVRAAIQAQKDIAALNAQRSEENRRREEENKSRAARGLSPLPMLPILTMGTGINTGVALAGLMGSSEVESMSYTLFGREVNLASRLEGASGHGRIFVSEATLRHLKRTDPDLAATAVPVEAITLKGFSEPVPVFEIPWNEASSAQISTTEPHVAAVDKV